MESVVTEILNCKLYKLTVTEGTLNFNMMLAILFLVIKPRESTATEGPVDERGFPNQMCQKNMYIGLGQKMRKKYQNYTILKVVISQLIFIHLGSVKT